MEFHKGDGKPRLKFESYRGVSPGDALGRLQDHMWLLLNAPNLRRQTAPHQLANPQMPSARQQRQETEQDEYLAELGEGDTLGGGALEAVLTHVDSILLVREAGLPVYVGYTDVGFGFDGGKQAGMLKRASRAGVRDWLMLKDSFDQDVVSVEHADRLSRCFSLGATGRPRANRRVQTPSAPGRSHCGRESSEEGKELCWTHPRHG